MSPLSRGISHRIPSMDNVLLLSGSTHPCINVQVLVAIGFMILGLGSLETSTLLPVPLYSCWGALNLEDLSGKESCKNIELVNSTAVHDGVKIWSCGAESWWQLTDWPGAVLSAARFLVAFCAGVGMDVLGRRRSVIAWMGVYFLFSFARSFAPGVEVFVMAVTMEALSAQASAMALLLVVTEGSTQKECVRSACMVLIGHGFGVAVLLPLVNIYIERETFRQLARSIPSVFFILYIFFLPESVRWIASRGRFEDVAPTLRKSHHVALEDSLRPKITSVYHETRKCLSQSRSRGNSVKQAIFPLILARPLWRVTLPIIFISLLIGSSIGFRLIHDPLPYQSVEDRAIASGFAELFALQLLGLLLARLPVRRVLFALSGVFTAFLLLMRALRTVGFASCTADIFFSCGGHFVSVMLWVWLIVGVIRLTPTHSRGTMLGLTLGFGTLGHSLSLLVFQSLTVTLGWGEYFSALFYAGLMVVSGLMVLILPSTPVVLPDMTSHLAPHLHWPELNLREENSVRDEENTRL